jgi:hypothetical protein
MSMTDHNAIVVPEPRGVIGALDELLRRPMAGTERLQAGVSVLSQANQIPSMAMGLLGR